jgi:hypothetical protein
MFFSYYLSASKLWVSQTRRLLNNDNCDHDDDDDDDANTESSDSNAETLTSCY